MENPRERTDGAGHHTTACNDGGMHRMPSAALLFVALFTSACGEDIAPTFEPQEFVGTWRGRWRDQNGRRGGLEMSVVDAGEQLEFACDLGGGALPGLAPPTERFTADIGPHQATIDEHRSLIFGRISGTLDAGGYLIIDCKGVSGPAKNLHAEGTWADGEIALEVDLTYDGSLRTSRATVEMKRK